MKLFCSIIFLLASTQFSQAQQFKSIVNEGAEWNNYYRYYDPQAFDSGHQIHHHVIKGDTIIDSVLYKKLWQYSYDSSSTREYEKPQLTGLLKEVGRKVFFRSCEKCRLGRKDSNDYLIYDFGLTVGDTFILPDFLPTARFASSKKNIISKDTITIVNGDSLKTPRIRHL